MSHWQMLRSSGIKTTEHGGENHQQVDYDYERSRYDQESNPWTNEQVPWEPMPSSRTETGSSEGYRAKREAAKKSPPSEALPEEIPTSGTSEKPTSGTGPHDDYAAYVTQTTVPSPDSQLTPFMST